MKHPESSCTKRKLKNGHTIHTCRICKDNFETAKSVFAIVLLHRGGRNFRVDSPYMAVESAEGTCPVSTALDGGAKYIPADPTKWTDVFRLIFPNGYFYQSPRTRKPLSFNTRKEAAAFAKANPQHKLTVAPLRIRKKAVR